MILHFQTFWNWFVIIIQFYTFEINYFHDCNKATYHNREDIEPISFKRSLFYWPLEDVNEEIVSFDDDFHSRKFFYPDIKMFLSCCRAMYFDVELTLKSHFFLVYLDYQLQENHANRIRRFKRYAHIGSKKNIHLRLLAIIIYSKSSYLSIIRMNNSNQSTDDKANWLIYYPSESSVLFNLPMKNIQDAFVEINEQDYDYIVCPCLLLYENLNYH